MRKKIFQAICAVFMGMFIYSCSELVLPEKVGVKGTLDLPIKIGAANLNSMLAEKFGEAFSADAQEGAKVYNVDYKGQTVQTFCIYLPIEMTEELDPDDFLKTIDKQLNNGIDAEPKKIDESIPYLGVPIPVSGINIVDIPPVSLADIAQYVKTIDFAKCGGTIDSGIGLNFHFTEIPDGLKMIVECPQLYFSGAPTPLTKGDNIFGNEKDVQLNLYKGYKDNSKKLNFIVKLRSDGPDPDKWNPADFGLNTEDGLKIKGEMRFFHKWEKAQIDLKAAMKTSSEDGITGRFPDTAFDLSGLNEYFDGEFTFNDLEVKLYMNGINAGFMSSVLEPKLELKAKYNGDEKALYDGDLLINSDSIKLDDYLNENASYKCQHLPESASEYVMDKDTIADIFKTMPSDLSFIYSLKTGDVLTVYPKTFDNPGNSGENSKIMITMMIMLPMSLTAEGDDDKKSAISFPDMFGEDDLFGRDEPKDMFSAADIDYFRIIIDFSDHIFTNGCLFIDKDKDLFPQGIKLNGGKIALNFTNGELEIIRKKLIIPDIRIEVDKGGMINVPKNMAVVNIRFEMKGLVNIGEL